MRTKSIRTVTRELYKAMNRTWKANAQDIVIEVLGQDFRWKNWKNVSDTKVWSMYCKLRRLEGA